MEQSRHFKPRDREVGKSTTLQRKIMVRARARSTKQYASPQRKVKSKEMEETSKKSFPGVRKHDRVNGHEVYS